MDFIAICHERNEVAYIPNMLEALESRDLDLDDLYYAQQAYGHRENIPDANADPDWWLCYFVEGDCYKLTVKTVKEMLVSGKLETKMKLSKNSLWWILRSCCDQKM